MKYFFIILSAYLFALGLLLGYTYGHIDGYVKGYDEAKECYTSFYKTLIKKFYEYEKERTTNVE